MAPARVLPSPASLLAAVLLSLLLVPPHSLAVSQEHVTSCASHRQLVSCTLCALLPDVGVTQTECCDSAQLLEECLSCLVDSDRCRNLLAGSSEGDRDKRFRVWWLTNKLTSARNDPQPATMSTYMKRPKYFLGKRARAKVEKRRNRNTFLGKRDSVDYSAFAKRGPFLGKRGPFLGKRQVKPFLGKRSAAQMAEQK